MALPNSGTIPANLSALQTDVSFARIWHLCWPQLLTFLFHNLVGFTDVFVAGRLGKEVQAAVGILNQGMFAFTIIAFAVASGTVASISQSLGAGKLLRAGRYVGLTLESAVLFGIGMFVISYILRKQFLALLNVPEPVLESILYILEVYLVVLPLTYFQIISAAIFRARQQVLIPLLTCIISAVLNVYLTFGMGLGYFGFPDWGYKGLAWSTVIAVSGGVIFNLVCLRKEKLLVAKNFPPWRWIRIGAIYPLKVAWPSGAVQLLWQTAYLSIFSITASLPHNSVSALAGMGAGIRVESIILLPVFAYNLTAGILIGETLGAGKKAEAKKLGYKIALMALISVCILALVVLPFTSEIAAFLAPDPSVHKDATNYIFYSIFALPFAAAAMSLSGAFTGSGATLYSMISMFVGAWLVRVPSAYILGHLVLGSATGVWMALLLSQVAYASTTFYFFAFRNWQSFARGKTLSGGHAKS